MKRFLVLLLLIAGGLAAASFSVPTNAAVVNGQVITQDQVTSDVSAIANSPEYACYLAADEELSSEGQQQLPPIVGAGTATSDGPRTTATTAFVANYVDQLVSQDVLLQVAARHHVTVSAHDIKVAKTNVQKEISSVLSEASSDEINCGASSGQAVLKTMPQSFVQGLAQYFAVGNALALKIGGDQQAYFDTHRSMFDTVCLTIGSYTTESDAQAERAAVYEGAKFADTGGQSQGCEVLYGVTSALPSTAQLQNLPLNTLSNPVSYNGAYLLIEMTDRSPTPYASAQSEVEQAVGTLGATKAQSLISRAELTATVTVNAKYGTWTGDTHGVIAPLAPPATDVFRASVNGPAGATAPSASG